MSDTTAKAAPTKRRPFYRDISFQVLIGLALGILVGGAYPKFGVDLKPFGDAFIRMIQMVIGPIIFCTVVNGIAEVRNLKTVGRIAFKAMIYFEVVTTFALIIGMIVANLFQPGVGMNVDPAALDASSVKDIAGQASRIDSTSQFLLQIIPKSAIDAFARGDILQILFFSVLFAGGLSAIGEAARPVTEATGWTPMAGSEPWKVASPNAYTPPSEDASQ